MNLPRVAVAVSGGRDSTALLHCTQRAALALGIEVVALHVHHGLMPQADAWLAHLRRQSRRWGARFFCTKLGTSPGRGDSVEAWARRERYRALAAMAQAAGCSLVLLAHHRRDQAETWLLQALRGAGPAGLSAMPAFAERSGVVWARPWLAQPREAIEAYVRRHRLSHIEDDSNADERYARNRLRLRVWPALTRAFPEVESTLAAAASRAQEAQALAREVAAADLPPLRVGDGLSVPAWLTLPTERRRNVLRTWLAQALAGPATEALVARLATELPVKRAARWPAAGAELRLYRGILRAHPAGSTEPRPADEASSAAFDCSQAGEYSLPGWPGRLVVETVKEGGAPVSLLRSALPQPRRGGERFCLSARGTPRSLKKQFQTLAVPAWERAGPLLYSAQGRLLFVPGLGLDATVCAEPGQPRAGLRWIPDAPAATGQRRSGR
ncbi:MAG: tRNA lysidine(34) synthetase TilS [Rubrivivax sp.]|nr:tRNA lysidine(34) synthetase TilS [Rubrivivax sp.]